MTRSLAGLMSPPNKMEEIKFWQAPMIFVHSCQISSLPSFLYSFSFCILLQKDTFPLQNSKSDIITVDVFCWMLHLMRRYIPTTEYRSVIFQPTSPTAQPIYLVNKEEVEETGKKHILQLLFQSFHYRL